MKLNKLKLTQLNNVELQKNEMKYLIGASSCGCNCTDSLPTANSANTNLNKGYTSSNPNACVSTNSDLLTVHF